MDALNGLMNNTGSLEESKFQRSSAVLKSVTDIADGKNFEAHVSDADSDKSKKLSAHDAHKKKQEAKLWDACIQTESIFVSKMLKEMRNTVHKGEMLNGGQTEEIFQDMLYDKYAENISKTANLGIAKSMYDQMSKQL